MKLLKGINIQHIRAKIKNIRLFLGKIIKVLSGNQKNLKIYHVIFLHV